MICASSWKHHEYIITRPQLSRRTRVHYTEHARQTLERERRQQLHSDERSEANERPTFAFEFNKTLDTVVKKECIKSLCVCGAAKPRNSAWIKWLYTRFWHTDNDMCPDHRSLSIRERWFNANVGLMGIPRRYHRAHVTPSSSKWTSHLQYSNVPHTRCLCLR